LCEFQENTDVNYLDAFNTVVRSLLQLLQRARALTVPEGAAAQLLDALLRLIPQLSTAKTRGFSN